MWWKIALAVVMLVGSNAFMTWAWYGHLQRPERSLLAAIFISWGLAFFEYCLHVPANRIAHGTLSLTQLKIIQEALAITVFVVFAVFFFNEKLAWNHGVAFLLIFLAVGFVFLPTQ